MSALTKGMGMIRRTAVLALLVLPLAFLATTGAHAAARKTPDGKVTRASGRCGSCHPDERVAFEKSRHAGEEMHCTSCHGGNDQTVDEARNGVGRGVFESADVDPDFERRTVGPDAGATQFEGAQDFDGAFTHHAGTVVFRSPEVVENMSITKSATFG